MDRTVADKNILNDFCIKFCRIIDKYTKYIIVSGFVAIASGRIRGTEDIDMIITPIDTITFKKLHRDLLKHNFVAMQGDNPEELYADYLKCNLSLRYTLKNSPVPEMEVKFAKDILDSYQIKARVKLPLTKLDVWFGSINMNIAFKEELLKSPKDLEDSRHLRIVYAEMVDEKEIDKIKRMIKRYRL
jgi:hypothetical protein